MTAGTLDIWTVLWIRNMLTIPRQQKLYPMNSRHGNVKCIYAGFRRYLKLGRNHVRGCLDITVHIGHSRLSYDYSR